MFTIVAASLVALAHAEEEMGEKPMPDHHDTKPQRRPLVDKDGNSHGVFEWRSRVYHADNSTEVIYTCIPMNGDREHISNDFNDKEIWC